jgi:hypothetical protein
LHDEHAYHDEAWRAGLVAWMAEGCAAITGTGSAGAVRVSRWF